MDSLSTGGMETGKACPLCGGADSAPALTALNTHGRHIFDANERFTYLRCRDCGTLHLTGVEIDAAYYRKYYPQTYYAADAAGSFLARGAAAYARWLQTRKIGRLAALADPAVRPPWRLLDLGCGNGTFLKSLPRDRFEAWGADINSDGLDACRQAGIQVLKRDLCAPCEWPQVFDIVTCWHVLEHLPAPIEALKNARRALKPGGIFILGVPDTGGLGYRLGRRWWFHLDAPRHLFLPNRKAIRMALDHAGFRLVNEHSDRYDYPLDLLWSVRRSLWAALIAPLYPLAKGCSRETVTYAARVEP